MKSVQFPQANIELAKDQPQYETLHVSAEIKTVKVPSSMKDSMGNHLAVDKPVAWSMIACFELTDEEIAEIIRTKKLWYRQMLYGANFQPMNIMVESPFVEEESNSSAP